MILDSVWSKVAGSWQKTKPPREDLDKVTVLSDAATILVDASLSSRFRVTLGGNRTLDNPINLHDGQSLLFELIQDNTGSRTITLGSKYKLGTDVSSVVLTTTANKRDFLTAYYNATEDLLYVLAFGRGY